MHSLILSIFLVFAGAPAVGDTLSNGSTQLHGGSIVPSAALVLSGSSGTVHLEAAVLGGFATGQSAGISGIQLRGGTTPVPEPLGGAALGAGFLGLLLLRRRRQVS